MFAWKKLHGYCVRVLCRSQKSLYSVVSKMPVLSPGPLEIDSNKAHLNFALLLQRVIKVLGIGFAYGYNMFAYRYLVTLDFIDLVHGHEERTVYTNE